MSCTLFILNRLIECEIESFREVLWFYTLQHHYDEKHYGLPCPDVVTEAERKLMKAVYEKLKNN